MKKMSRSKAIQLLILSAFCLSAWPLYSQERITGLYLNQQMQAKPKAVVVKEGAALLSLPFFEDFSVNTLKPNNTKWENSYVFVNKDFPLNPTNTGAATFDVLDETGKLYAQASSVPFVADYLTSLPIRLDTLPGIVPRALTPADSVYFSFWYQPQGRGDKPETNDSLVLQFGYLTGELVFDHIDSIGVWADDYLLNLGTEQINPLDTIYAPEGCDTNIYIISDRVYTWGDLILMPCDSVFLPEVRWQNMWSVPGIPLDTFQLVNQRDFKQVMVPVKESQFFNRGFQFRFFNYGSTSGTHIEAGGNVDQWNVDFIYLNANRHLNDTTYNKIGFSGRAPSFLKRYESMPYRQYRAAPTNAVKPEFHLDITNLDGNTKNTKYKYVVDQLGGTQHFEWDGGNCNLAPFSEKGFQTCETACGAKHACPPLTSLFALDFEQDTASFLIRHYISDSSAANILVDSLIYRQGFYNYFAYDDGTPEAGYSIEPNGAYVAMQFSMTTPDSLYAIQIHFNRTNDESSTKFFDLMVWGDNGGQPGEVLYRKIRQKPVFEDTRYGFTTFKLDEPLYLNGNFYIGFMRESGTISFGFDRVNNAKDYLFYNIDGNWTNSSIDGALMMRAVTDKGKITGQTERWAEKATISVRPNPANQQISLHVDQLSFAPAQLLIYDLTGRVIIETDFVNNMDISQLEQGVYLISVRGEAGQTAFTKFIVSR